MSDTQAPVGVERLGLHKTFPRFTLGQRWEHAVLLLAFTVLLLTGLPQKYRAAWGHYVIPTPEALTTVRTIHRVAAVVFALEAIYHLGRGIALLARRRLPMAIFPTWQDVRDAGGMLRYLLFLTERKPAFGKYNFEQKFTYWFLFFAFGIMIVTGFMLWFPVLFTGFLPGGIIPAAKLAHSTEAVAAGVFVVIWHFYHVHLERLNLSIFTGWLSESDMREYHALEHERLAQESSSSTPEGTSE